MPEPYQSFLESTVDPDPHIARTAIALISHLLGEDPSEMVRMGELRARMREAIHGQDPDYEAPAQDLAATLSALLHQRMEVLGEDGDLSGTLTIPIMNNVIQHILDNDLLDEAHRLDSVEGRLGDYDFQIVRFEVPGEDDDGE